MKNRSKLRKILQKQLKTLLKALLTEALAVKELEKAFGSFEAGTFKRTLEEIAKLTERTVSEIETLFANAGLTEESFSAPDTSSGVGSPDVTEAPTFKKQLKRQTIKVHLLVDLYLNQ